MALCCAWWWLHFTCRQLLYQSCLVNFLNTHIYYLYLKSMLKNKTKQNKKKPAVNFAIHCVNMYICLSSLFNFIAYFCYCSCYCNMFLFLQCYVAAVTNKFPHLQDIKGFLILISDKKFDCGFPSGSSLQSAKVGELKVRLGFCQGCNDSSG